MSAIYYLVDTDKLEYFEIGKGAWANLFEQEIIKTEYHNELGELTYCVFSDPVHIFRCIDYAIGDNFSGDGSRRYEFIKRLTEKLFKFTRDRSLCLLSDSGNFNTDNYKCSGRLFSDDNFYSELAKNLEENLYLMDNEIWNLYNSWDKGDCSNIGMFKIFFIQMIKSEIETRGQYYQGDFDELLKTLRKPL